MAGKRGKKGRGGGEGKKRREVVQSAHLMRKLHKEIQRKKGGRKTPHDSTA